LIEQYPPPTQGLQVFTLIKELLPGLGIIALATLLSYDDLDFAATQVTDATITYVSKSTTNNKNRSTVCSYNWWYVIDGQGYKGGQPSFNAIEKGFCSLFKGAAIKIKYDVKRPSRSARLNQHTDIVLYLIGLFILWLYGSSELRSQRKQQYDSSTAGAG